MIALQIERLRRSRLISRLVVATSDDADDDAIIEACAREGVETFRGSRDDVLSRYLGALQAYGPAAAIVRVTADCPLTDPALIDEAIRSHGRSGADITTVQLRWTFPKGLDIEVIRPGALVKAGEDAVGAEREHVTANLYKRPEIYRINGVDRDPPLHFRWTVDTLEDFEFVRAVYEDLYPRNPAFTSADILAWQAQNPGRAIAYDPFASQAK
jgi:spore coat polysaccharide biosynthesis protein SpsF